tara:strand:+ start:5829 stop:6245 length:417 start_codon:yes stop_codon:yes gene_type:complete
MLVLFEEESQDFVKAWISVEEFSEEILLRLVPVQFNSTLIVDPKFGLTINTRLLIKSEILLKEFSIKFRPALLTVINIRFEKNDASMYTLPKTLVSVEAVAWILTTSVKSALVGKLLVTFTVTVEGLDRRSFNWDMLV